VDPRRAHESSGVASGTPHRREALAAAIREIRGRKGLTQENVADAAGLNRKTVGSVERLESVPSFDALTAIAHGLGVAFSELALVYEARLRERDGA
jgi:transcriptional regulator with XRE-family HTH domain